MSHRKKYLIALEETRSIVALSAGILVLVCTVVSVFIMIERYIGTSEHPLHYFTVWSNLLSALAAAFTIPYAAEGIRKKRFVLPRWIVLLQYAGATCVATTMAAALAIIWPTQGIKAVTGVNFWLHIVAPVLTLVLFQCIETGVSLSRKDFLLPLIPFGFYMSVYFVMVVLVGKENGGWSDFYMTLAYWPGWVSALLMTAVCSAVSLLLRLVQNKRAAQSWKRISRAWSEDLEPTQLLIEAFGLGRYIGTHCAVSELTVPLDIFMLMSKRYSIPLEKITKAFFKGALDAVEEKRAGR